MLISLQYSTMAEPQALAGGVRPPRATGDEAPEEVAEILTHLAHHRHVRGCVTLTLADARVIWYGGSAFESPNGSDEEGAAERLRGVVSFVQSLLTVIRENIHELEADVRGQLAQAQLTTRTSYGFSDCAQRSSSCS